MISATNSIIKTVTVIVKRVIIQNNFIQSHTSLVHEKNTAHFHFSIIANHS